jgi:hypothetical protein
MISSSAASDGASFLYPALTDTEQQDTHAMVEQYRRTMGRTRILTLLTLATLTTWGFAHSRRGVGKAPKQHRRYRHAHA